MLFVFQYTVLCCSHLFKNKKGIKKIELLLLSMLLSPAAVTLPCQLGRKPPSHLLPLTKEKSTACVFFFKLVVTTKKKCVFNRAVDKSCILQDVTITETLAYEQNRTIYHISGCELSAFNSKSFRRFYTITKKNKQTKKNTAAFPPLAPPTELLLNIRILVEMNNKQDGIIFILFFFLIALPSCLSADSSLSSSLAPPLSAAPHVGTSC